MSNTTEQNGENIHVADQVYFLYDPQPVRLLDVVYVGPVMIYGGIKGKFHPFVKWSLIGVGICTILYNGINFVINEKKALEKRKAKEQERLNAIQAEIAKKDEMLKDVVHETIQEANIIEENEPIQDNYIEANEVSEATNVQLPQEVLNLLNETQISSEKPAIVKSTKRTSTRGKKVTIENGKSD